jgi:CYTH domain-containing protein
MPKEIERKFLVTDDSWKKLAPGVPYRQGYLCVEKERTVRVREAGARGYLTIKGAAQGLSRSEYEYEIPVAEAREMLAELCLKPLIEKQRHRIPFQGMTWEVDEFLGDNQGLVVAEIELDDPQQRVALPPWVGREVTGDHRYANSSLGRYPYKDWREDPAGR